MFPKYYHNNTLSTPLSTQKVCHMSNFILENEVNTANQPLKVEQPFQENSSEMDKLLCFTIIEHSLETINTVMGTNFPSREFCVIESSN